MKSIVKKGGAGEAQQIFGVKIGAAEVQVGADGRMTAYIRGILVRLNLRLDEFLAQTMLSAPFPSSILGKAVAGAANVGISLL